MSAETTTENVYKFIEKYLQQHGYAPTQREIAAGCYLSPPSVRYHLGKLIGAGRIHTYPGHPRALGIVADSRHDD